MTATVLLDIQPWPFRTRAMRLQGVANKVDHLVTIIGHAVVGMESDVSRPRSEGRRSPHTPSGRASAWVKGAARTDLHNERAGGPSRHDVDQDLADRAALDCPVGIRGAVERKADQRQAVLLANR